MNDSLSRLRLDGAGIFWVSWCGIWTLAVVAGMVFLFSRRDMPLLRIRGLHLSSGSIALLHTYWMVVQTAYIFDPFPQQAEYWVMGIYLPFGIALFHASNTRFLYVARQQRRQFFRKCYQPEDRPHQPATTLLGRLRQLSHTRKTLVAVGVGMLLQLLLTVITYLLSRKFHPSLGLPGTEASGSPWDVNYQQARGWEWWPSIIWQFFWSWVVAPAVLWRARHIHDTLGWRTQTLACCIAGLPATPMWLIALHVPGMASVNRYWIPPQWIATSIMFLEIFSIFLPCWQVWKHQTLRQETLDMITAWELKHNKRGGEGSSTIGATSFSEGSPARKTWKTASLTAEASTIDSVGTAYSGESLLTMGALEYVLEHSPDPLREFSASKDFSGENVAFLTAVADWKTRYQTVGRGEASREAYNKALHLYTEFIGQKDAEFPINISYQDRVALEAVFEKAARVLFGKQGLATPAIPFSLGPNRAGGAAQRLSHGSERPILGARPDSNADVELRSMAGRIAYWGEIPAVFDTTVFDKAVSSIKYLVLTNTWPKFVRETGGSGISMKSCSPGKQEGSFVTAIMRILSRENHVT